MNDASEMLIGTAVDERYFVEAEVGRGRGGALYRARHMVLQNPVVLKVVHRELIDRGCSLRTLREEAMASARISSPHAVTVADFGLTVDQRPYFAMDLLEGRTLDEILREQAPLSEAHAVALLEQIEDVLSEMHAEGMVHGSVRPDNVFVTKRRARDFVKLLGVGMGTLAAVSEAPSAYTSPEQRVGDPLDPRADVFSLAVTAYEMATGALPFAGVDMLTHRGGPPSVRERNASFSASYADAVARALDDDPAKRFESVAAFIEALTPPQQVVIKGSSTRPVSLRDVQDPERFVETQHAPLDNSLPGGGDLPPAPVLAKMRARVASLKATDASKRQQIVLSPDGAPSGLTAREIDDDAKTGQHVPFTGEIPIDDAHPAVEAERAAERVQSAIAQSLDDSGVQAELDASEMPTARPRDPARMAKPVEVTVKSPPPDAMGGEAPKRSGSIDVGDVSSRGFGPADAEAVATLRNVPSVQINTDELDAAAESAARDAERAPQDAQQDGAAVQEGSADDPGATQPLLEGVRPGSKPLAAITLARVSADKAKRGEEDAPRPEAMTLKEAPSVLPPGSKTLISTPLSREDAARLRQAQAQALQPTVSQVEVDAHADANVPADDELDIDPGIAVPAPLPLAEVDNMDELDALEASELADDDDTALGPYAGPLDRPFDNTAPVAADPAAGGMSFAAAAAPAPAEAVSSSSGARASGEIDRGEAEAALAESAGEGLVSPRRAAPSTEEVEALGEPYPQRLETEVIAAPPSRARPILIAATIAVLLAVGAILTVRLVGRTSSGAGGDDDDKRSATHSSHAVGAGSADVAPTRATAAHPGSAAPADHAPAPKVAEPAAKTKVTAPAADNKTKVAAPAADSKTKVAAPAADSKTKVAAPATKTKVAAPPAGKPPEDDAQARRRAAIARAKERKRQRAIEAAATRALNNKSAGIKPDEPQPTAPDGRDEPKAPPSKPKKAPPAPPRPKAAPAPKPAPKAAPKPKTKKVKVPSWAQ